MKTGRVVFREGVKSRRRKGARRGIKTTVIVPQWQKKLKADLRGLKRDLLYLLAVIGGLWMTYQALMWLSTHVAGGG